MSVRTGATKRLTVERLRQALDYDPETGVFRWKDRSRSKALNGGVAGCSWGGYIKIKIDGVIHQGHRLAWLYVYGEWPKKYIDHINGNPSDNRIANLRDVDPRTNAENSRLRSVAAQAGHRGVIPGPVGADGQCSYIANIYHHGKSIYLGKYRTVKEAAAAYLGAKRILHKGFVPRDEATDIQIIGD